MIFVAGILTLNPAIIEEFQRDIAAMRPKVLTEQGCQHYSLLVEDASTGKVNVHEIWDDDDALKMHFTMPWIADFFARYSGHMQGTTVQIFDISGQPRPLPSM